MSRFMHLEKFSLNFSSSSFAPPTLAILIPFWFIDTSLMFLHRIKLIFKGFLQFEGRKKLLEIL